MKWQPVERRVCWILVVAALLVGVWLGSWESKILTLW